MSHVDDGALHAYLDGALDEYPAAEAARVREHLDACAECATRLEAERASRADARAILALATPHVDLPAFEDLRAYVERTRPAPSPGSRRLTRLGWAASVLLALGTGWVLRGEVREGPLTQDEAAPPAITSETAAEPVVATVEPATDPEPETDGVTGLPDEVFDRQADVVPTVAATGEGTGARGSEDETAVEPATSSPADGGDLDAVLDGMVAPTPLELDVPSGPLFEPRAADVVASLPEPVTARDGTEAVDGAARQGAERELASESVARTAGRDDAGTDSGADRPVTLTSALSPFGRGGIREVPEDDERFDDEPVQAVPGFEVMALDNIGDGLVFLGTVVTQRLEGDAMLRIYHLEADVDLSVLPALDPSLNEVRVLAERGWVVMRGPRSVDELETLLMRLFPR